MNSEFITFTESPANLFTGKATIAWQVQANAKLNASAETRNPEHTKQWATRHALTETIKQLFTGRKTPLQIPGYGNQRHLQAIDRLNMSIKTLASINDHYSFLSYCNSIIIPDLWKLCPGPSSPFKNYRPKLETISTFIKTEQKKLMNQLQPA